MHLSVDGSDTWQSIGVPRAARDASCAGETGDELDLREYGSQEPNTHIEMTSQMRGTGCVVNKYDCGL